MANKILRPNWDNQNTAAANPLTFACTPACHVVAFLTHRSFSEGGSENGKLGVGGTSAAAFYFNL